MEPIHPLHRSDPTVRPVSLPRLTPRERDEERERREQERRRRAARARRRTPPPPQSGGLDIRA